MWVLKSQRAYCEDYRTSLIYFLQQRIKCQLIGILLIMHKYNMQHLVCWHIPCLFITLKLPDGIKLSHIGYVLYQQDKVHNLSITCLHITCLIEDIYSQNRTQQLKAL